MLYIKAPGRCIHHDFVAVVWGEFVRHMEIADDQFAVRQVEVFDNGNVLRYDRSHWCDDFGQLLGLRFSRKPKWAVFFPGAELVEAAEFERVWRRAQRSLLWKEQLARSRAKQWGVFALAPRAIRHRTRAMQQTVYMILRAVRIVRLLAI